MKSMWLVFALAGAFTAAVVVTLSKAGIKNINPSLAFAIQSVFILVIAWAAALWQGALPELATMETKTWIYLSVAGVVTAFSSLLTFQALKLGDAAIVSPIERLSLVFAIIFAVFFLKEKINWQIGFGALLMAAGAIIIAMSKKQ